MSENSSGPVATLATATAPVFTLVRLKGGKDVKNNGASRLIQTRTVSKSVSPSSSVTSTPQMVSSWTSFLAR